MTSFYYEPTWNEIPLGIKPSSFAFGINDSTVDIELPNLKDKGQSASLFPSNNILKNTEEPGA